MCLSTNLLPWLLHWRLLLDLVLGLFPWVYYPLVADYDRRSWIICLRFSFGVSRRACPMCCWNWRLGAGIFLPAVSELGYGDTTVDVIRTMSIGNVDDSNLFIRTFAYAVKAVAWLYWIDIEARSNYSEPGQVSWVPNRNIIAGWRGWIVKMEEHGQKLERMFLERRRINRLLGDMRKGKCRHWGLWKQTHEEAPLDGENVTP